MSSKLVICSNKESETDADLLRVDGGMNTPYKFMNHLSSTEELPANCQVAMTSAKLNLMPTIDFGDNAFQFYQWWGKVLDPQTGKLERTTSIPIRTILGEGGEPGILSYNVQQLADEIRFQMDRRIFYPGLRNNAFVIPTYDAAGNLLNYQFGYTANGATDSSDTKPTTAQAIDNFRARYRNSPVQGDGRWRYNGATGVFETQNVETQYPKNAFFNSAPLSPYAGQFVVDITNVAPGGGLGVSFAVGLSRGNGTYSANGNLVGPTWWQPAANAGTGPFQPGDASEYERPCCNMLQGGFGDFVVYMDTRPLLENGTAGILRISQMVTNTEADPLDNLLPQPPTPKWRDVPYGDADIRPDYDMNQNPGNFESIKYKLDGEKISISLFNNLGVEQVLMVYDLTVNKAQQLKPVAQDCWNLHPILAIDTSGQVNPALNRSMQIKTYEQMSNNHPSDSYSVMGDLQDEHSWWMWIQNQPNGGDQAIELNLRDLMNWGVDRGTPIKAFHDYLGLVQPGTAIRFEGRPVHILQEEYLYGSRSIAAGVIGLADGQTYTNNANCETLFGFPNNRYNDIMNYPAADDDSTLISSLSPALPAVVSTKSIFVRLENMGNKTINASRRNKSAIVAHLPRFDGNRSSGALYLEPKNLIFVDLDNPAPMKVNDFDISLCYSDEKYCESLTGTTIVCLLFRENPHKH